MKRREGLYYIIIILSFNITTIITIIMIHQNKGPTQRHCTETELHESDRLPHPNTTQNMQLFVAFLFIFFLFLFYFSLFCHQSGITLIVKASLTRGQKQAINSLF